MYDMLAITNRNLCKNDFLEQIKKICILNNEIKKINLSKNFNIKSPNYNLNNIGSISIVLREKDICEEEYEILALKVIKICKEYDTDCILHTYYNTAKKLGLNKVHLSLKTLKNNPELINEFHTIGVSIHSVEDALKAQSLGTSYITAGHIFDTDCKKGLPGRGLVFLSNIINSVNIPVFAIGGICSSNIKSVLDIGSSGVCIMSGLMNIDNPKKFFR